MAVEGQFPWFTNVIIAKANLWKKLRNKEGKALGLLKCFIKK